MQVIWDITPRQYQIQSDSDNYSFYSDRNMVGKFDIYVKLDYNKQGAYEVLYGNANLEQEKSINLEMKEHMKWVFDMFNINSDSNDDSFNIIIQSTLDIASREFIMNYLYNVPQNKYTAIQYHLCNVNSVYPIIPVFIKNTDEYINSALSTVVTGTDFMPMRKEFFFITTDEFNRLKMLENVYFAEFHNNILTLYRKRNGHITFCKSKCSYIKQNYYPIPEDQELMDYIENSIKEMYNEDIWATNWDVITLLITDLYNLNWNEVYSLIKTYGPPICNIIKNVKSLLY